MTWHSCAAHMLLYCLFAPQLDMTTTLELLKTQIFNDYGRGNEDWKNKAEQKKKKKRKDGGISMTDEQFSV